MRVHRSTWAGSDGSGEKREPGLGRPPRGHRRWEGHLGRCGTQIVKFFLNVSRASSANAPSTGPTAQQALEVNAGDVAERAHWDAYVAGLRRRDRGDQHRRTLRGT